MASKELFLNENNTFSIREKKPFKTLFTLKPKVKIQSDFYVFDTETGKRKQGIIEWELNGRPESFIFGCVVGHNYRKEFHSREEMILEFLSERYKGKKVFAHNAEYDLTVLFGSIFHLDPKAIFNGKFISAYNGVCTFADSLNIYKASVKEIGLMLGMLKKGMSGGDYSVSNWNNKEERTRDINGCFRDCEIIYEALIRIFEDAGDIKITQASLSMSYYRRFHQPYNIDANENIKYFWDSYFGGRCEAFKIGKTNSTVYDVNSMYPYAMKFCKFPNPKFLKILIDIKVNDFIKNYLFVFEGCIYCEIEHFENWIGFLPIKAEGKLLFPIGSFSGCWNFNEIRFALERKAIRIKRISKIVFAPAMESPFISFVDNLYFKRFATDNKLEIFRIKIFLNSLYGKFAQRITEETIYIEDIERDYHLIQSHQKAKTFIKLSLFNQQRRDAFLIVKPSKKIDASFSIPSFASYITSFSRVLLLNKMLELEKNKVVYCDTDSIFVELEDFETANNSSNKLGVWKKEDKIITGIYGLKNYTFIDVKKSQKEIHRIKGIPLKAIKIKEGVFTYENLIKTKEGLRRNLDSGVKTKRTKVITGEYSKRIVANNGETKAIKI